ncbi:MAG: Gfo/Idh/MocA family oxidoreductase [Armatimonadetes bacterium]|nr:Gfo/Idh/MocA family oxidoreductase [Armatimonadota bacterium]
MQPLTVGVMGCGAISSWYLRMAPNFAILDVAACADLDGERAAARAEEFGIPRVCTPDELLADPGIEVVLNLTVPQAHAPIGLRALEAGKHHFTEKPLAIDREEGRRVYELAREKGLRLGSAPDTCLGAGIQTARKAVDEGLIGRPVAFTALMLGGGAERFHPNPEFFYKPGAGPMFDMGPYYLTTLLNLLGPVKRIVGGASIAIPERVIASQPLAGQVIHVETPDHVCGILEFEGGALGSIMTSFATRYASYDGAHPITLYGTEGELKVPDPNSFDGVPQVRTADSDGWRDLPLEFVTGYNRAVGLADMAYGIRTGRKHRCSAEQAFAVLDLMQGFLDSSATGQAVTPCVAYERPAPMPAELAFGELDA